MLRVVVKVQEFVDDRMVGETSPVKVDVVSDASAIELRDLVVEELAD